eukprot:SM000149S01359  [mRNA]  locus=s149:366396:367325:- [translate_table: standard]
MSRLEVLELHVPDEAAVTSTAMATLASSCVRLRELHVHTSQCHVGMPDLLEDCPPMPALVRLSIMRFEMSFASLMAFSLNAPLLEGLSLEACELVGTMQAPPAVTSLRSLECRHLLNEPAVGFWRFGAWCPNLTSLVAYTSPPLCGSDILASSLAGCSQLATLKVGDYTSPDQQLAGTCPPLGALRALDCSGVHWRDVAAIAKAAPHLQEVRLTECNSVKMEVVLDLLSSCPELGYIRASGPSALSALLRLDCCANDLHVLRAHVREVVHLEVVEGCWEPDRGCDPDNIGFDYTTYRVHRCGRRSHPSH